jgi:TIR domain
MGRIEKTVFISYRRHDAGWANAVFMDLTHHGYDVFIDYDGIGSGIFETAILENIRARAHFLVLLTRTALERSSDPKDWMRREIEAALDNQRNIVPMMLEGFKFGTGDQLTGRLAALQQYNALIVPEGYLPQAMEKLRNQFLSVPVDAVLHPASASARLLAEEQKDKAVSLLEDEHRKLASPENSKDPPLRAPNTPRKSPREFDWFFIGAGAVLAISMPILVQPRESLDRVRDLFITPPAAPPTAPGTNAPLNKPLTPEQRSEIAAKIDILVTSNNFHNDFAGVDRVWADTESRWVGFVKTNRPGFISIIEQMREVLGGVSSKMSNLRNESREYPDIYALFDDPKIEGAFKALGNLSLATAQLADPPPPDFDITLRHFVGIVTIEVGTTMAWFNNFENRRDALLKQLKVQAQQ